MIGLTEQQLWHMTPRTFHNLMRGRMEREESERKLHELMHQELVLAVLSPHMKKSDRDRAYNTLNKASESKVKAEKKNRRKLTPEEVKAFLKDFQTKK